MESQPAADTLSTWSSSSPLQGKGISEVPGATGAVTLITAADVQAYSGSVFVLDQSGWVWNWGSNSYSQRRRPGPQASEGLWIGVDGERLHDDHSGLRAGRRGVLWARGCNDFGQLGDGTKTGRTTPRRIPGLSSVARISGYGPTPTRLARSARPLPTAGRSRGRQCRRQAGRRDDERVAETEISRRRVQRLDHVHLRADELRH